MLLPLKRQASARWGAENFRALYMLALLSRALGLWSIKSGEHRSVWVEKGRKRRQEKTKQTKQSHYSLP